MTKALQRPLSFAFAASLLALVTLPIIGGTATAGATTAATGSATTGAHDVSSLSFNPTTVGDILGPQSVTITNTGSTTVSGFAFGGANPDDFIEADSCTPLAPLASCQVDVYFTPGEIGLRQATLVPLDGTTSPPSITLSGIGTEGYYEVTAQGAVAAHGDAQALGDTSGIRLTQPIVASAATGDDAGYWLVAADGGIFSFGDAGFFGSTGAIHLNKPIVGMAATADGRGLLAGGLRRRHLHLRRRRLLRLDRGHPSEPADRRHGGDARRRRLLAGRLRRRHLQPSATPASSARPGPST